MIIIYYRIIFFYFIEKQKKYHNFTLIKIQVMKKQLFLLLFLFSFLFIQSQSKSNIHFKAFHKHISLSANKSIVDTIMPASYSGNCLDSLSLFYADYSSPYDSGWVCGSNSWQDKEKAQKYYINGNANINALIPLIPIRKGSTGTIYAKVYSILANGAPGTLLRTSNGILMTAIDTTNFGINFHNVFTFSPAVPVNDSFFVSITIPNFVMNSSELAIFSENISCSSTNTLAWEQWSDNTWHSFKSAWGTNLDLALLPVIAVPSSQNDILSFSFSQQISPASINPSIHQVYIEVGYGTNLTNLIPTITLSPFASINPLSGIAQNFSSPFIYNVSAENGTLQSWTINVSVSSQPSSANDILSFSLSQLSAPVIINSTNHTVIGQVVVGTNLNNLTPTITVSPFANINPLSGTSQNFTTPFAYTVNAQDGTPQNWIVTLTVSSTLRNGKNIISFSVPNEIGTSIIDTVSHYVSAIVPIGTNRSNLSPVISVSPGATISPLSGVSQNFNYPVAYTVTAENLSTQNWVVSVNEPNQSSANDILSFTLSQLTSNAIINNSNHTVTGEVVAGTDRSNLSPTITVSPYATLSPLSGSSHNFLSNFTYTVNAQNGAPQDWIITLTEALQISNYDKNEIKCYLIQANIYKFVCPYVVSSINIYNLSGQIVYNRNVYSTESIIDLNSLGKGLFIIELLANDHKDYLKISTQ